MRWLRVFWCGLVHRHRPTRTTMLVVDIQKEPGEPWYIGAIEEECERCGTVQSFTFIGDPWRAENPPPAAPEKPAL